MRLAPFLSLNQIKGIVRMQDMAAATRLKHQADAKKFRKLYAHVKAGGRYFFELGGLAGGFSAQMARDGIWVINVDQERYPMLGSPKFTLADYIRAKNTVHVGLSYKQFLSADGRILRWLQRPADKVFLIMPYPWRESFQEEVAVFREFTSEQGELYLRTERPALVSLLEKNLAEAGFEVEKIPFLPEARSISFPATIVHQQDGRTIHEIGFRKIK